MAAPRGGHFAFWVDIPTRRVPLSRMQMGHWGAAERQKPQPRDGSQSWSRAGSNRRPLAYQTVSRSAGRRGRSCGWVERAVTGRAVWLCLTQPVKGVCLVSDWHLSIWFRAWSLVLCLARIVLLTGSGTAKSHYCTGNVTRIKDPAKNARNPAMTRVILTQRPLNFELIPAKNRTEAKRTVVRT